MFTEYPYLPYIKIKPSELTAYVRLPDSDKIRMLPIIGLRRWRGANKFESVAEQIAKTLEGRPCVVFPCRPSKITCEAEERLSEMFNPANGYSNWVDFVRADETLIPGIVVAGGDAAEIRRQALALNDLGRGLALVLKRDEAWNLPVLDILSGVDFGESQLLIVLDYGQIQFGSNISLIAAELVGLAKTSNQKIATASITFAFAASSFPIDFAGINRESARLPIRERQLFESIAGQISSEFSLVYTDYASVFAGERGIAQAGAPRVDLPTRTRWVYHRKDGGTFSDAAVSVMADRDWDNGLLIWGTERIRQAATGNLDGLAHAQAWTAVRIHLHMHQQVHFDGPSGSMYQTDEVWED